MTLSLLVTHLVRALTHQSPKKREERLALLTLEGFSDTPAGFFLRSSILNYSATLWGTAQAYPSHEEKVTSPAMSSAEEGLLGQMAAIAETHLEKESVRRREAMLTFAEQSIQRQRKRFIDSLRGLQRVQI